MWDLDLWETAFREPNPQKPKFIKNNPLTNPYPKRPPPKKKKCQKETCKLNTEKIKLNQKARSSKNMSFCMCEMICPEVIWHSKAILTP
jgi:hypothetical protein